MSKPIARVTLLALISLMLIAATSFSVRGWLDGASERGTAGVQSHNVGGLQTNFNHDRSTTSELEELQSGDFQPLDKPGEDFGGGCQSEHQTNPNDF